MPCQISDNDRGRRYASSRPSSQESASMNLADILEPITRRLTLNALVHPPFGSPQSSNGSCALSSTSIGELAIDHLRRGSSTTPTARNRHDARQRLAQVLEDVVRISNSEQPVHLGKRKAPSSDFDLDFQGKSQ